MARSAFLIQLLVIVVRVQQGDSLLMDDADATTSSRLDALEAMLSEERQLRLNLSAQVQELAKSQHANAGYPAFMATLSADLTMCTTGQHVIFNDVRLNVGDVYNPEHGTFTAPIAGIYLFTATLSANENSHFKTAIVKNDASNLVAYLYALPSDSWLERSTAVAIHLDVNDEVWMKCRFESTIQGEYFHSHMSGMLISPDT